MRDSREVLNALLELTQHLIDAETLELALQHTTDAMLRLFPNADHTSVRLLDDEGTLVCGARSGAGSDHAPVTFRKGEGIAGWVAENGEVALIADTARDRRFVSISGQGFVVRSILAVPMFAGGHVVGVVASTHHAPGAFDDHDVPLARLLANCVVPLIEKARLKRLAVTDPLTRAFNQRFLVGRLEEELERSRRHGMALSLLCVDVDHFKQVNDRHGHAGGDAVLCGLVDRLRRCTRRYDVVVRRGGDELVLIMPATSATDAEIVALRIAAAVRASPFALDNGSSVCTVSIGVATWNGSETPGELERRGDKALYGAKAAGRDCVVVAGSDHE